MRNSDMPAYPLQLQEGETSEGISKHGPADGLTKREYFAVLAMQGLLSGVNGDADLHDSSSEWRSDIAGAAIDFADALLSELEK